ncbi:nucleotidyltransferase [candidate division KSB1 bacterium]|nr:nucleotidyltransferase [candidate division KSB1 bacterium]MBL7095095.1 nucleotidyltransferase [candidate division KSB1 bacterium]
MSLSGFEKTLFAIDTICKNNSIPYALIGGLSAVVHQIPRTTQDIDITLLVDIQQIREIGEIILTEFTPLKDDPLGFFEKFFVLPVYYEKTKIRVDFSAGLSGFDNNVIKRSQRVNFGKIEISLCSVEDLIIYKLVASRLQDLADIEALFKIHHQNLNRNYLFKIAKGFVEVERSDIVDKLENYFSKFH